MEETIIKNIEATLDSLEKVSVWIFLAILISLVSTSASDNKIKIGDFEIDRRYSGISIFILLCALNFYSLKLYNNLYSQYYDLQYINYDSINAKTETLNKMLSVLRGHNWIFNPFSETKTLNSKLLDNLGIALNIVLWWLGYLLGVRETTREGNNAVPTNTLTPKKDKVSVINKYVYKASILTLSFIYLLLGIFTLKAIIVLSKLICNDFLYKWSYAILGITIGLTAFLIVNGKGLSQKISEMLKIKKTK